ncbi:hypothetical protein Plo01_03520 [Planobispora longispora]|uniref:Uncharacterized protein n=1 Tax=Planobispora longispora TaxID=28887 RepID=A0A8J3W354_9ACTN|nr:hypothetical protein Plo01_03520 [Planobispora longispora]
MSRSGTEAVVNTTLNGLPLGRCEPAASPRAGLISQAAERAALQADHRQKTPTPTVPSPRADGGYAPMGQPIAATVESFTRKRSALE